MIIETKSGILQLPAFLPDATHAALKGMSIEDVKSTNTPGLVTNTYHLILDGLVDTIEQYGGIHKYMGFEGYPIITDSGGFQAMSLVRRNKSNGKITDDGVTFKNLSSGGTLVLTPESCIDTQIRLGSDIIMCLDDCTDPAESYDVQLKSVQRTIDWAKRCKKAFENTKSKALIFAIIQGGNDKNLRKMCADELINIGFDGYAYGGWPMENNVFMNEILEYTASLMPDTLPKYAMGVGKPIDIENCVKMGYNLFDCVLPTRDARHNRLYVSQNGNFSFIYINSGKYKNDFTPISDECDCYTCKNYIKSHLYHLSKSADPTFYRLSSIHNLRFYSSLMERLAKV